MIERHMPDVKVVGVDRGGVGTKHRNFFFIEKKINKSPSQIMFMAILHWSELGNLF